MGTATQIVFILYALLVAAAGFGTIGKRAKDEDLRRGMAILAFLWGLFTIAFVIWWDPADTIAMYAKFAVIGLMWIPWLLDLRYLGSKELKPPTIGDAMLTAGLHVARIGLVLGFWTLY